MGNNVNIIYGVIYLIITFSITLISLKFFGKQGLFIWICISIIISNIQSVKLIEIFGFTTVLGNIAYSNIYLATDILNERYGKKAANKSVLFGFLSMFIFTGLMMLSLVFIPSVYDSSQDSLSYIFMVVPRICAASLLAFLSSQFLDVFIYNKLKKRFNKMWLSNNGGTLISQIVDTIIFVTIGFVGTVPVNELISMGLTMYFLKAIIALCDTGFLYIAKRIKVKSEEPENKK